MDSTHHGDSSCATGPQDAAVEAANPGRQRQRIPAKGCRHLLVKPCANGTRKGNTCQLCGAIVSDKGEITGTSKAIQRRLMTAERTLHSRDAQNWTCRTRSTKPRDCWRKPIWKHKQPEQSGRSSMPSGRGDGRNGQDQKPDGSEPGGSRSMKTEETLDGWYQKRKMWKIGYEAIKKEEERLSQCSASISSGLPRQKCMQFCSVLLLTCEEELFFNTRVLWWQLFVSKKDHTAAYKYSMLPCSRSFEMHTCYFVCCP